MAVPLITSLYAGICALMLFGLSLRVIFRRGAARVSLGHGDDESLERRIRAQANFVEYVPLVLVLMLLLETAGTPAWRLHLLGLVLLLGRGVHAWALEAASGRGRRAGMALTFIALAGTGLWALTNVTSALF